ncbi:MAG: hypothetical protein A3H51_02615 [Candidatus Spechtbacteria bacterium RIFCSPLOWO2_02_FULL_38_8]|uniref:Uncharacterized protein n=1 Tax=Candidatus Spechtbacteria bacterium RIFCSPLOWO2_02_FULL_38_8 TaxID=1802164 RepID=A0A1G2HGS6_9BACT|nr:MAG: hypothetical protein A3H51_02615 [Candidatus Spechtbacteria bacterium RIFCSPLOWO2_02_FULL_38_8]
MKFESIKNLFESKKRSEQVAYTGIMVEEETTEKDLVGSQHIRMDAVEAHSIISDTINISSIQQKLKSDLFKIGDPFIVRETIEALARLVLELRERILQYDTILSDDASGRLPSLLILKIIKKLKGGNMPQIYFLAGGRYTELERREQIRIFLKKNKDKFGKTLLVTEYIRTGESIGNLIALLEKANIIFDTASVTTEMGIHYVHAVGDLIYGKQLTNPSILYKPLGLGVKKDIQKVKKDRDLAHPQRNKLSTIHERAVREDLEVLAEEFVKLLK